MAHTRAKRPVLAPQEAWAVFDSMSKAALADLVWRVLGLDANADWLNTLTFAVAPVIRVRGDRWPYGLDPRGRSATPAPSSEECPPPVAVLPVPTRVEPLRYDDGGCASGPIAPPRPRAVTGVRPPLGGVDEEGIL